MTPFNSLSKSLQKSLENKSCLKVIAGLSNFDAQSVSKIAHAAGLGGAHLLDVACNPKLVRMAMEMSGLPVCVSAVEPHLFLDCVEAGAQMVEIGNFDSFYQQGRVFSAEEVLGLAIETRRLLPGIALSVTVPHVLPLDKQADLAEALVIEGVDLIQTEGGTSSRPVNAGVLGLIEKASPTLAAVHTITQRFKENGTEIPVLCASGLSHVTVPMAFASGASGVGVGSAINRLRDEVSMRAVVRGLCEVLEPVQQGASKLM